MGKRIELDEYTSLFIPSNGDWSILGLGVRGDPVPLSDEARENLLAALLMEEGS